MLLAATATFAAAAPPLDIRDAWAAATPPGARTAAVYLTIANAGPADALKSATATVADEVEFHAHEHSDGMMRMRRLDQVDIAAQAETTFEPGGLHVMLIGLNVPLVVGQSLELELEFSDAGTVTIVVPVRDRRR